MLAKGEKFRGSNFVGGNGPGAGQCKPGPSDSGSTGGKTAVNKCTAEMGFPVR